MPNGCPRAKTGADCKHLWDRKIRDWNQKRQRKIKLNKTPGAAEKQRLQHNLNSNASYHRNKHKASTGKKSDNVTRLESINNKKRRVDTFTTNKKRRIDGNDEDFPPSSNDADRPSKVPFPFGADSNKKQTFDNKDINDDDFHASSKVPRRDHATAGTLQEIPEGDEMMEDALVEEPSDDEESYDDEQWELLCRSQQQNEVLQQEQAGLRQEMQTFRQTLADTTKSQQEGLTASHQKENESIKRQREEQQEMNGKTNERMEVMMKTMMGSLNSIQISVKSNADLQDQIRNTPARKRRGRKQKRVAAPSPLQASSPPFQATPRPFQEDIYGQPSPIPVAKRQRREYCYVLYLFPSSFLLTTNTSTSSLRSLFWTRRLQSGRIGRFPSRKGKGRWSLLGLLCSSRAPSY